MTKTPGELKFSVNAIAQSQIADLITEKAELEIRLAALEADKDRLDWLDKQRPREWEQVLFEFYEEEFVAVNFCNVDYEEDSQYYTGDNWREVIDAAREDKK